MSACLALEQTLRVAYLGPPGTYSHEAVAKHFGHSVDMQPCATIDDVFRAAESGATDHAVVPVENSTEGAVGRTLDLMFQTPLVICGEIRLRVRQNLLSTAAAMTEVTRVYSHAQSLAQCAQWLARHLPGAAHIAVASNAEAARLAAAEPRAAAIAGEQRRGDLRAQRPCAAHRGRSQQHDAILGAGQAIACLPPGRDETSLVMSAPNRPGAVHSLLEPFAKHGVSMTRLESRPARTGLWEYLFYVDLAGHETDAAVAAALAELCQKSAYDQDLGIVSCSGLLGSDE